MAEKKNIGDYLFDYTIGLVHIIVQGIGRAVNYVVDELPNKYLSQRKAQAVRGLLGLAVGWFTVDKLKDIRENAYENGRENATLIAEHAVINKTAEFSGFIDKLTKGEAERIDHPRHKGSYAIVDKEVYEEFKKTGKIKDGIEYLSVHVNGKHKKGVVHKTGEEMHGRTDYSNGYLEDFLKGKLEQDRAKEASAETKATETEKPKAAQASNVGYIQTANATQIGMVAIISMGVGKGAA